ncbi:MAG TPA: macro domain-containing protein [Verrucomicrobiae bacterium]
MPLTYQTGDATRPLGDGQKIIVHVCNDVGAWGKGFVTSISKRWKEPEARYRAWFQGEEKIPFALGEVQFVSVTPDITIANLIGQRNIRTRTKVPPIRYDAVQAGLAKVAEHALKHSASVHMPRIGCGLAGGKWEEILPLIEAELIAQGISVTVYDFA